jgi:hypothetical protein
MSYYSDASLVMIPSGVKNGTVFSQKPLSSDGELTFTRSNDTATRVGPDGLIEKVRTNLNTTVESAGNGWYRIKTVLHCTASGSHYLQFGAIDSGTAARAYAFAANNTDGYLVWGGQSETGVTTDYIATTSAAVSVGPVANLPRLDYSGGATCPSFVA